MIPSYPSSPDRLFILFFFRTYLKVPFRYIMKRFISSDKYIDTFYIYVVISFSLSRYGSFPRLLFSIHLLFCSRIGFPFIAIEWPERFVVNIDVHIDDTVYSRFALHCPLWILRFATPVPREAYGCRPVQLNQGRVIGVRVTEFDLPSFASLDERQREVIEVHLHAGGSHPGPFHSAELARVIRNAEFYRRYTSRTGPIRFNLSFHLTRLSKDNVIFV